MTRPGTVVALLLLTVGGFAQDRNGYYCAHTGFNLNIGSGSKSFQCRPAALVRGQGTLSFTAADNTVTCSGSGASCFTNVAAVQAVPGSDGNFWNTSALIARVNGQAQFYNISTRTSSSSLEVADGTTAPASTVTTTDWSYWNTTCYRNAATYTTTAAAPALADQRIWGALGSPGLRMTTFNGPVAEGYVIGANSTIQTANVVLWTRSIFTRGYGFLDGGSSSYGVNTTGTVVYKASAPPGGTLYLMGVEFTFSHSATTAGAYSYACFMRSERKGP